ncbi:hypothetical protein J1605_010371 [Eschrichtius robustus]|uniref:Uncharacterized protein n=1 Tax=Eschrichtius robustus TaxID=9764 RepID=A0AB34GUR6_ESCRO|nr:hypothetical protein J1605_010371 [Eschrichtius robustus]
MRCREFFSIINGATLNMSQTKSFPALGQSVCRSHSIPKMETSLLHVIYFGFSIKLSSQTRVPKALLPLPGHDTLRAGITWPALGRVWRSGPGVSTQTPELWCLLLLGCSRRAGHPGPAPRTILRTDGQQATYGSRSGPSGMEAAVQIDNDILESVITLVSCPAKPPVTFALTVTSLPPVRLPGNSCHRSELRHLPAGRRARVETGRGEAALLPAEPVPSPPGFPEEPGPTLPPRALSARADPAHPGV